VAEGGVIIGVVRVLDLLHTLSNQPEAGHLPVTSCKLVKASVQPSDSISIALSTMFKNHVDRLPVVSEGKVVGIITEKDILRKWHLSSQKGEFSIPRRAQTRAFKADIPSLKDLPLSSFDTHVDIRTVRSTELLGRAIEQMYQHNINNILVVEDGSFVGLLAPLAILQKLLELSQEQPLTVTVMGVHETHLQPAQISYLQQIATQEAAKLQRELRNPVTVKVHVKEYFHEKAKKRHKYAVTLQVNYPGRTITGSQDDWDIETAVRKTFANALNEVTKKFGKVKKI
jgi:predicted transcriptional regulator